MLFEEKPMVITSACDAARTSIEAIEEVSVKHNIEISHCWWTHFKEGDYRFTDENIKDNANDEPWSCRRNIPRK